MLARLLAASARSRARAYLPIDIERHLGIPATNDGGDAEWSVSAVQGEHLGVEAHAVCQGSGGYRGFVLIPPVVRLIACLLDELSTVWNKTGCDLAMSAISSSEQNTHDSDVPVDGGDLLVRIRLQQLAGKRFLESEHNTILASDADGSASVFCSLDGVLDLYQSACGKAIQAEGLLESFGHREKRRSLLSRNLCLLTSWAVRLSR
jgi:hypothetical protein